MEIESDLQRLQNVAAGMSDRRKQRFSAAGAKVAMG